MHSRSSFEVKLFVGEGALPRVPPPYLLRFLVGGVTPRANMTVITFGCFSSDYFFCVVAAG